jgi:peptidyl-prolyl cis-trans isomerase SurA
MKRTARHVTGHRRNLGRAAVAMTLAGLIACSGGAAGPGEKAAGAAPGGPGTAKTPAPDPGVLATLGGEPIPYKSFERYLADNGMDDTGEGEQDDVIKSHLLDQFLEEQLLLRAARGLKIAVSEAEIDAYLQQIGVSEGEADVAGPEGKEGFRDKVRQELIIQKVKDAAVLSKVQVSPGEVDDYIKKQPELQRTSRRVVLRQILVDDKSLADRLRATVAADPSRFEAVAREKSVASDRGQARGYDEEELPVELRAPLFALEPGQISPVIENAQRFLIFQVVQKAAPREADPKEVRRTVQLKLFQQKSEQALERYVADLRKETEIRVNPAVAQFSYTGEYK